MRREPPAAFMQPAASRRSSRAAAQYIVKRVETSVPILLEFVRSRAVRQFGVLNCYRALRRSLGREADGDNGFVRPIEAHGLRRGCCPNFYLGAVEPAPSSDIIRPCLEQCLHGHIESPRFTGFIRPVPTLTDRAQSFDSLVADGDGLRPPVARLIGLPR